MRFYEIESSPNTLAESLILEAHSLNEWSDPISCDDFISLLEATVPQQYRGPKAAIRTCPLFDQSFDAKKREYPLITQKMAEFLAVKQSNPLQPFGGSDKPFNSKGNFGTVISGLRHAHLTHDIMVAYTLGGRDPIVFNLYGVFSHDELGIGQPANVKKQKAQVKRMANQPFN